MPQIQITMSYSCLEVLLDCWEFKSKVLLIRLDKLQSESFSAGLSVNLWPVSCARSRKWVLWAAQKKTKWRKRLLSSLRLKRRCCGGCFIRTGRDFHFKRTENGTAGLPWFSWHFSKTTRRIVASRSFYTVFLYFNYLFLWVFTLSAWCDDKFNPERFTVEHSR